MWFKETLLKWAIRIGKRKLQAVAVSLLCAGALTLGAFLEAKYPNLKGYIGMATTEATNMIVKNETTITGLVDRIPEDFGTD